ncbi:hypothetical protein [Culicoidibacter larvae]|uniref:FUSC family protein n=1 Tax=Culicoidibacter larvae TaxID=2579976 RepID=A0A5R8QCY5_9FIRM|nr:hypothetical protein [Culicoidibacter larvae]TLG73843.1 hypothetical protein FEZ08_06830 [Culicoidibacter larvae]
MKQSKLLQRLSQTYLARVHILHAFLLSCLILLNHLIIPGALPYFPLTIIISLLIFQQSSEHSRKQAILVVQTSLVGILFATAAVLWLQAWMLTLPFVLLLLIFTLKALGIGRSIVAPAILVIAAYSMDVEPWFFLILGVDIAIHAFITVVLTERIQVKLVQQFKMSYHAFKDLFAQYRADAAANVVTDATPLFQQLVQLQELFAEIKDHQQLSHEYILKYDQMLLEIEESYFYLRQILREQHCLPVHLIAQFEAHDIAACSLGDYNHVYVFHAEQLLAHEAQWHYLEAILIERGADL